MIIEKIKSINWTWFWSGNWPLLDSLYEKDLLFQKEFFKNAGIAPRKSLDFYRRDSMTAYHDQLEYERLEKFFIKKFKKNPKFLIESYKNYNERTKKDLNELKRIVNFDLSSLSNFELGEKFRRTRYHFVYNMVYDHYAWYMEKFFVPLLEKYLQKKVKNVPEILSLLITPQKKSRFFREREDFFALVDYIKKKGLKEKEYKSLVKKHIQKYGYLPVLVNNNPVLEDDILKEINSYLKNNKRQTIESVRLGDVYDEKTKKKAKNIIKKLKPSKEIKLLIEGLRETAYVRTEDNAIMGLSTSIIRTLQEEITKRLGISYLDLKTLVPEEIIFYLRYHINVSKKLLKKRKDLTACYTDGPNIYLFTGKEAGKLQNIVKKEIEDKDEFKGVIASSGYVKGRAFVAETSISDLHDFKEGDILIAPATSADFVPLMRKASAVITEFGGLTSHAGIVSREFKIPCIVGVKDITKIVKTGETIEVDATKGLIRRFR